MDNNSRDKSPDSGEMDVFELLGKGWAIVIEYKYWAILTPVLFLLAGTFALRSKPPQWEATALLVMSRACEGDAITPCRFYELAEPVDTLVARASSEVFQASVLKSCGLDPAGPDAALYRGSQSVRFASGPNYVDIKIRAYSRKTAVDLVSAVAAGLASSNAAAGELRVKALKEQLSRAENTITALASVSGKGGSGGDTSRVLALYLKEELQAKAKALSQQIEFAEKNTASFMAAKSGASIVDPKTFLLLVSAGLSGVFMGILIPLLIAFLKSLRRRASEQ